MLGNNTNKIRKCIDSSSIIPQIKAKNARIKEKGSRRYRGRYNGNNREKLKEKESMNICSVKKHGMKGIRRVGGNIIEITKGNRTRSITIMKKIGT